MRCTRSVNAKFLLGLGFECPSIYGDPGILTAQFYRPQKVKRSFSIGIIPHHSQRETISRIKLPQNYKFIDISREGDLGVEDFITELVTCERIFSSSLHGIILAQAYGIPAQWIKFEGQKLSQWDDNFKFIDYFSGSGQLVQHPIVLKSISDIYELENITPPEIIPFHNQETLLEAFPMARLKDCT